MNTQLIYSSQGEFAENNSNYNLQNEILNALAKIECKLNKIDERLTGLDVPISTEKLFPISSLEELSNVENKVASDIEKYGQLIKLIISPEGLFKNFNRIFSDKVIMAVNYDGVNNKKSFKDYKSLNQALFYATTSEGSTSEDLIKELRKCFRVYKNRTFKKEYDQRKKLEEESKH